MGHPITRRSALSAALSSLVAAGAASALPGQAEAQPTPIIINGEDLAAESRRLHAEVLEALQDAGEIEDEITERFGWGLLNRFTVAEGNYSIKHQHWMFAELACHLPGLAPVLRMLEQHIMETAYSKPGACCTVANGFEA